MIKLYIFLFILAIILFCQKNTEPFDCNTLRCGKNKYSITSMKNTLNNKITAGASSYIANIKNFIGNFKEQWL